MCVCIADSICEHRVFPGEVYSCAGDQCGIEVDYDKVTEKVEKEKTYEEEAPGKAGTVPKK